MVANSLRNDDDYCIILYNGHRGFSSLLFLGEFQKASQSKE